MTAPALGQTLSATAEIIAEALGGRKVGAGWIARCPAHDDRKPSLSIGEGQGGTVLVHCHAGCDQRDVIAALNASGLWSFGARRPLHRPSWIQRAETRSRQQHAHRSTGALGTWTACKPAKGTKVENYLALRGIQMSSWPLALRFHVGLKHPSGGIWPAMVALVTHGVDGSPLAIHRTFLARDSGGKAPVEPQKMMLGPCRGGAVRLAEPGNMLMVGEGIETCLAVMQATGHPAWAALSTSGLRSLDLPAEVRDIIVLADGDDPGEAAACACALRWKGQGRRVRIARPPHGMDFNDLLVGRAPRVEEGMA
jgi:hypothetical protein